MSGLVLNVAQLGWEFYEQLFFQREIIMIQLTCLEYNFWSFLDSFRREQ